MENILTQLRKDEITQLQNAIAKKQSCVVYGMPGVGVSSFLRFTEKLLDSQGIQVVNLDLNLFSSYSLAGFIDMLFSAIRTNLEQSGLQCKYKTLDEFIFEKKQPITTLVIQIDRFEKALQFMKSDFFDFLKAVRDNSPISIVYVIGIDRDFDYYQTFAEQDEFHSVVQGCEIVLKPFDKESALTYIKHRASQLKLNIHEQQIHTICETTGGHLRHMNLCLTLFADNNSGVLELIAHNQQKFDFHSARIFASLMPLEQQTLKLIVQNDNGLESTSSYQKLKMLGFIANNDKLFSTLFTNYVCEQTLPIAIGIYYDPDLNRFYKNNHRLDTQLTVNEFKALQVLYENKGTVVERDELADKVWGARVNEGVSDEAIDQLIKRLREKIEDNPQAPSVIVTVRGRGFVIE